MKRSSGASKGGILQKNRNKQNEELVIDWEVRPGGMLVQKRSVSPASGSPMIKIKVSHDSYHLHFTVPTHSTFGELKRLLAQKTGLEPAIQRLLFRGKEKEDDEYLHIAGVEDLSKLILLEDPASREKKKFEEMNKNQDSSQAYEAVANVGAKIDKLSDKVLVLETNVQKGIKVEEKEFVVLTELLMVELLKLDSIEADGEARLLRRAEVHRVQRFVDKLDNLKAKDQMHQCHHFQDGKLHQGEGSKEE